MTYCHMLTGLTVVVTCVLPLSADESTVCTDKFWVVARTPSEVSLPVGYAASHELDESNDANDQVTRLVVIIHPSGQNALGSLVATRGAATAAGAEEETLILCPQFPQEHSESPSESQIDVYGMRNVVLHWNSLWRQGNRSIMEGTTWPASISSFEVVNQMIETTIESGNFPNIDSVILAGHSAGGQFVDLFSKVSNVQSVFLSSREISMRYLVCAPSNFAWLDENRPDPNNPGSFTLPDYRWASQCKDRDRFEGYNDWRYGLTPTSAEGYPLESPAHTRMLFEAREVTYIVGGDDFGTAEDSFVTHCQSMLQGSTRIERMTNHFEHLKIHDPDNWMCTKSFHVVPGHGHSEIENFRSEPGQAALFGPTESQLKDDRLVLDSVPFGSVEVLLNDYVAGCGAWEMVSFTPISTGGGAVYASSPGILTYMPPTGYTGYDSFTYRASLDGGDPQEATVQVYVLGSGTIQAMIDRAADGDTIIVPPGVYYERITIAGKSIYLRSADGPESTTIDGLGLGHVVSCLPGADANATSGSIIEGFTIRGGDALTGGGVHIYNVDPMFRKCHFTNNRATWGSAVYTSYSSSTFINCSFEDNHAMDSGGIYARAGALEIRDCEFARNTARYEGPAILTDGGVPAIVECKFSNNAALSRGGACSVTSGSYSTPYHTDFLDCVFEHNDAIRGGGALYLRAEAHANVDGCTFRWNHSFVGGALLARVGTPGQTASSTVDLSNSHFCANTNEHYNEDGSITDLGGNVFYEICADAVMGDFNDDGKVNGQDLAMLLGEWGQQSELDLTGNGYIDGADLAKLLGAWQI